MIRGNQAIAPQSWVSTLQDGAVQLSLAGWWCLLISTPLFFFLLVRWVWRFVVWGLFLGDLARLDLQLAVMHPDRTGGLAFIGEYPPAFTAFVFALSSVFAAAAAKAILHAGADFHIFLYLMAAWLVLIIVLFALPLAAFVRPLGEFKKRMLLESSALAERANRAIEQRWLGHARDQKEAPASTDAPSRSDPAAVYEAARKMKSLPLSKASVLPLAIAVLIPMIAVGATQLPIRDILKFASRLLI
jgi:pimeloyl-ACP methyl ester carboxylesterase